MTGNGASLVAQQQRLCLPRQEMQETWVRSLGRENPVEKEMATHSSTKWQPDLGNRMDRGALWAIDHEVAKSHTQRSN